MFAYVSPQYDQDTLTGWLITTTPSDWFAVGWDDPGSTNDNHDDMMMVAHVRPVPLPAAVWLFGSALLGVGVVGNRRRRQI